METIPPEIWFQVFALACSDDGFTGRALSLASRSIHLLSRPFKYQSIGITGPHQLLKSLEVLSSLPPGVRKVKYLFIGGLDDPRGAMNVHAYTEHSSNIIETALLQILQLLASNLLALNVHCTSLYRPSLLPEIDFPVLRELTLHGPFKPPQAICPPTVFPSLRRIHIHHFGFHPANFLQHIVQSAPMLRHLHVPQNSFTPYDIQVALGFLEPGTTDSAPVYLPDSLEELVIELFPPNPAESCARDIRASQFLRKFQKISAASKGRVCLVDGRSDWVPTEKAKEEWLEYGGRLSVGPPVAFRDLSVGCRQ